MLARLSSSFLTASLPTRKQVPPTCIYGRGAGSVVLAVAGMGLARKRGALGKAGGSQLMMTYLPGNYSRFKHCAPAPGGSKNVLLWSRRPSPIPAILTPLLNGRGLSGNGNGGFRNRPCATISLTSG